ncbi:MAG TPA: MBL fold metallo-hydrolase [Solirubrobacteraceae bacterium]
MAIASQPERVADGVWRIKGGAPVKLVNVFLIEDGDGVTVYDAGIRQMSKAIAAAAAAIGPLKRVILGNSHADHRGAAPGLGAPVYCGAAERDDAEGDGGWHYFDFRKLGLPPTGFVASRVMGSWDAGPVKIVDTLAEGDAVAGFSVIEIPGHSPGTIGLWRESDRLVLSNDCFALFDARTTMAGRLRVPHEAFNYDTELARASVRKLAALEPATAWPGHYGPLTGDVRAQLEAIV